MAKKILITGAGGFIGGYMVAEALERGYETWAAVRATTSRQFLQDPRIHFIELDFTDPDALALAISNHVSQHGKWQYVVHNLGATKCTNYAHFNLINCDYMKLMVEALCAADAVPEVFLMISSLSVMGIGDEVGYKPFTAASIPRPNTYYGVSKFNAESYLRTKSDFPFTIFRCTGVYGPHERDYFMMMKSIKMGFDFSVGFKKQMLTFIYVKDLAVAVMQSLEHGATRKAYFISHPQGYTQQEFRQLVAKELGKRFVLPVCCPLWAVKAVCRVSEFIGMLTLKPSTLNSDKFRILKQRNWLVDISEAQRDFGFDPKYDLAAGVHEAVEWYKQAGWL
ncbi:MAG: NAD-dependent epimerase/dehydratase family protein [Muribaculaceae bacterium]